MYESVRGHGFLFPVNMQRTHRGLCGMRSLLHLERLVRQFYDACNNCVALPPREKKGDETRRKKERRVETAEFRLEDGRERADAMPRHSLHDLYTRNAALLCHSVRAVLCLDSSCLALPRRHFPRLFVLFFCTNRVTFRIFQCVRIQSV